MNKLKKLFAVLLCISLLVCLTGCGESKDIKEAKECIDNIYQYTNKLTSAQIELKSCTDEIQKALLENKIALNELLIQDATNILMEIYSNLSEKGQAEVKDYVATANYNNLINIWNN